MTFSSDIMRAAREAFISAAPQMDRASAERIRAGAMDESHATTIIATAILAERQRCSNACLRIGVAELSHGSISHSIGAFKARAAVLELIT